jgi:hypothetical protein
VFFQPWSIGHLGDNSSNRVAVAIKAEVQVQRAEIVSEVSQEREQALSAALTPGKLMVVAMATGASSLDFCDTLVMASIVGNHFLADSMSFPLPCAGSS